ncbi:lipoprotein insertase outer membrane protein LolB [Pseudoalteromonas sp. T1lg65]|uniref:lipoprotein insertase outer membrane protein LolB n=1 Tax=Pseudoalteromonas sp. T1lg65 TaxID=2077101 RepID=UPI003F7A21F4
MKQLHLILLMFLLFLAGCAQRLPEPKLEQNWKTALQQKRHWQARGKLAFIAPDNRQSANFNWDLADNKQHLILTSFIGTRVFELEEFERHSTLTVEEKSHTGKDSSDLIKRLTGLSLPVEQAPLWLTATISNDSDVYDDLGRLVSSEWQSPSGRLWQIQYQRFSQQDGMWLPSRMKLQSADIEVKVQISNWQF